jgi:PIN domain nuclease of toxin-antitoxin system
LADTSRTAKTTFTIFPKTCILTAKSLGIVMRLLLDTHAFVWSVANRSKLSPNALAAIASLDNEVFVSAVSAYEIEYKRPRDPELQRLPGDLGLAVQLQGYTWIGLSWEDGRDAGRYPPIHRDPWDRLLIAQANRIEAALVTRDMPIVAYGFATLW